MDSHCLIRLPLTSLCLLLNAQPSFWLCGKFYKTPFLDNLNYPNCICFYLPLIKAVSFHPPANLWCSWWKQCTARSQQILVSLDIQQSFNLSRETPLPTFSVHALIKKNVWSRISKYGKRQKGSENNNERKADSKTFFSKLAVLIFSCKDAL